MEHLKVRTFKKINFPEIVSIEAKNRDQNEQAKNLIHAKEVAALKAEVLKLKIRCGQFERETKEHRDTELRFAP